LAIELDVAVLGPLAVRRGGVDVALPAGKQRAVLAALLLSAGRVVSLDELAEAAWGDRPPASARVTLQNYVKRLRHAVGDTGRALIVTHPGGYRINLADDAVDVRRFEVLQRGAQEAAGAGEWQRAAEQLREALSLWRGEPLTNVPSDALLQREKPRLVEMHSEALEARIDADLQLGRHGAVIAELRQFSAAYPLRERPHGMLMLALYRDGRRAEALAVYQHARDTLVSELGLEPGPDLRDLHQRILSADPALSLTTRQAAGDGRAATVTPAPATPPQSAGPGGPGGPGGPAEGGGPQVPPVPRQLPAAVRHFAGRQAELKALAALLDRHDAPTGAVVISAIGGTAGIGKTALALHFAHRVTGRFPDGQLYVNLRGFDPSCTPLHPAAAVRGFLGALGVTAEHIPADLDAQTALYRSMLAGKRTLILLDNACDTDQVRPLLPGSPGSLALITSRRPLTALAATQDAHLITLDVLSRAEAHEMLARRLGPQRVADEPQAAAGLVRLCAGLPLALAVTAARATAHPSFSLAALAAELRDEHGRLDALNAGEAAADVRAVFSWSYRQLTGPAARMFRLLGVHPGPDISACAAASLAGVRREEAGRSLWELTASGLLTERSAGRYALHDLLRAYAKQEASASDGHGECRTAIRRILDHYLHTACRAERLLNPTRDSLVLAPLQDQVAPEYPADRQEALAWFEAEHQVLLSAVALAAQTSFHSHAWQLPWAMTTFLDRRGHWHDWLATQRTALTAAQAIGDRTGQAHAHRYLGRVLRQLGSYQEARGHLRQALRICRQLGDGIGQARAHQDLSFLLECEHQNRAALHHLELALDLFRAAGHRPGQAETLNGIGWYHAHLGDVDRAIACCDEAMDIHREFGNRHFEAATWDTLGYAHHRAGSFPQALRSYGQAIELLRQLSEPYARATVLIHAGDTHQAALDCQAAGAAWQEALDILNELQHPDAEQVRAKLRDLAACHKTGR
jgi:DNA-binding SARP family transcriptional activator/tetratricopeptide (TPR) repeat protein